jgi:hypothetical protein
MGVLVLLTFAAYLRFSTRTRGLAFVVYLVVGAFGVFLVRFDLAPACVMLLALWAAERRHFRLAYILIACGVLLKLYPAFLFPVIAVAQWRADMAQGASGAEGIVCPRGGQRAVWLTGGVCGRSNTGAPPTH